MDPRRKRPKQDRSERGDTLIEILIAIAILGIVAASTLLGFSTAISSSATYRSLATMDTALRSAVSEVTTEVQANDTSTTGVSPCAYVPPIALPTGFVPRVTSAVFGPSLLTCTTALSILPQLITVNVTSNGSAQSISFVVDDPLAPAPTIGTTSTQLVFLGPIGNTVAGYSLTNPQVEVEDANGRPVPSDLSAIILSVTGSGGTPLCQGIPSYGVVTFYNCKIAKAGTYTLTASEAIPNLLSPVTGATSSSFQILTGPASQLAFTAAPGGSVGGSAFAIQPVVTVEDAAGNPSVGSTTSVTLALGSGSGTVNCAANPVTAVTGVAAFTGCTVALGTPGPFTLKATASGLTTATTSSFTVTGPATQLVFTTSPGSSTFGTTFVAQPVVTVEDASGSTVTTGTSSVTLTIGGGVGSGGCTVNTVVAVAGVASFTGCRLTQGTIGPFTLNATATGLSSATSSSFTVAAGPAAQLVFTSSPGQSSFAAPFATQPVVTVEDAGGNPVPTSTVAVTLALGSGTGTGGCTINTVNAVAGAATFAGCQMTGGTVGVFTLKATAVGLTSATTVGFSVAAGPATQLVFATSPASGPHGTAFITQPIVSVKDASGNTVTGDTSSVTLTVSANAGGGSLSCAANPAIAVGGVATFTGCQLSQAGAAYTITASDGALTRATSIPFTQT